MKLNMYTFGTSSARKKMMALALYLFIALFFTFATSDDQFRVISKALIKDAAGCVLPQGGDSKTIAEFKEMCLSPIGTEMDEERCFGELGCFPMKAPWTSIMRPLPKPMSPDFMDLKLDFYSRNNTKEVQTINLWPDISMNGVKYDPKRPYTTFITHGFTNYANLSWVQEMKDNYLKARDANVFLVDWKKASMKVNYLQVASNTRVVGAAVARFVQHLIKNYGLKPENIHLIGHSLGAQISAYIAKRIPNIGVLTALDPAQPGFEGLHSSVRLDKSDATHVEVVHTSGRLFIPLLGFGYIAPAGHVDFYFNGGALQPRCVTLPKLDHLQNLKSIEDLALVPVEVVALSVACSHMLACDYYTESILPENKCKFVARITNLLENALHDFSLGISSLLKKTFSTCTAATCTVFGLDTKNYTARGVFAVDTNLNSPYCKAEPKLYEQLQRADDKSSTQRTWTIPSVTLPDLPFPFPTFG